jgi:hypothetical protein
MPEGMALKTEFNRKEAESQLNKMQAQIQKIPVQTMAWLMNKFARQCIRGLFVETSGLKEVE